MTSGREPEPADPPSPALEDRRRAKSLPLAGEPPALVPARMINEILYCERLMYLEWAQHEFADNEFTVEGRAVHRRADRPRPLAARERPEGDASDTEDVDEPRPYEARSVWLSSERYGITGKLDIVDVSGGSVIPVEYKRGKKPNVPEGAYLPERAQLCAQVLLLRDNGHVCESAEIYFAGDRRRVPIDIDAALIDTTLRAVRRAKQLAAAGELPPPLVDSPKCNGCSLVGICLPDEVNLLNELRSEGQGDAKAPRGTNDDVEPLRRLHPARDDRVPLYVQDHRGKISLDGEVLRVFVKDKEPVEARLSNTSQVCVLGNAQITTPALRRLLDRGIPVGFFSYAGWFVGRATGHDSKNVELRIAQYRAATDPATCLRLARGFVVSKILNCRTLLRRNHDSAPPVVLFKLTELSRLAVDATSLEQLLGFEGTAARFYFSELTGMLNESSHAFDLKARNRRPPRDPINALLSFCYALLTKDFALTLAAVGLDPLIGFYHQPRFGRPSLALDLMEEFRPLVGDSVVLSAINTGVIRPDDFVRSTGAVALKSAGRRRLIAAYERRMDQLVSHPVFGYRISYRRVLEVQARLLGRVLLGELDEYPPFRTR